jgi:hypothetical protein
MLFAAPQAFGGPSCKTQPFCVVAPFSTASTVATSSVWGGSANCGGLTYVQAPTFSTTTGIGKADVKSQSCNSPPSGKGQWGVTSKVGATQIPWTFTGTTGTILTVTDNWSVSYSGSFSITCGGGGLGPGQQVSNGTIYVNGSTVDTTTATLVNGATTSINSLTWTSCGVAAGWSTSPTTFLVTYTISLTHGDAYVFDSELIFTVSTQITPSPPSTSPAYSAMAEIDLEPLSHSTSLVEISAQ